MTHVTVEVDISEFSDEDIRRTFVARKLHLDVPVPRDTLRDAYEELMRGDAAGAAHDTPCRAVSPLPQHRGSDVAI